MLRIVSSAYFKWVSPWVLLDSIDIAEPYLTSRSKSTGQSEVVRTLGGIGQHLCKELTSSFKTFRFCSKIIFETSGRTILKIGKSERRLSLIWFPSLADWRRIIFELNFDSWFVVKIDQKWFRRSPLTSISQRISKHFKLKFGEKWNWLSLWKGNLLFQGFDDNLHEQTVKRLLRNHQKTSFVME